SQRHEMAKDDDLRLVGFQPVDNSVLLTAGAHFLNPGEPADMANDLGWMTSVAYSPELGHSIGLGYLKNGEARIGDVVRAYSPVRNQDVRVKVCSPHHIDPEGERQRG
ncbi:MAG: glycine cleavage T C-terminal barrel domain-containing protein, partial [Pseudomonadota bacterium]